MYGSFVLVSVLSIQSLTMMPSIVLNSYVHLQVKTLKDYGNGNCVECDRVYVHLHVAAHSVPSILPPAILNPTSICKYKL